MKVPIGPARSPANLQQWEMSRLVEQLICPNWLIWLAACSVDIWLLQKRLTIYWHLSFHMICLGRRGEESNSDMTLSFFSWMTPNSSSVWIDYAFHFHPVHIVSADLTSFMSRISIKIYTIFRRFSAISLICLLCDSWEIKDRDNKRSSQQLLNQKESWENRLSVSRCT